MRRKMNFSMRITMSSDARADDPIKPGFRLKVGSAENGSSRAIQNEINPQWPVASIRFGSPVAARLHRRRYQDRVGQFKRSNRRNHLVDGDEGIRPAKCRIVTSPTQMLSVLRGVHVWHAFHAV